jgi:hypothetical protein
MDKATSERFAFQSEGGTLVGNLFMPERRKPAGVVVAVGPLTSVKEQAAGVNGYAVQSFAHSLPFDARGAADLINVPVLLVHSEQALAPDLAHAFFSAVTSPKQELWLASEGQIDFYDDPKLIGPAADAAAAFLASVP